MSIQGMSPPNARRLCHLPLGELFFAVDTDVLFDSCILL